MRNILLKKLKSSIYFCVYNFCCLILLGEAAINLRNFTSCCFHSAEVGEVRRRGEGGGKFIYSSMSGRETDITYIVSMTNGSLPCLGLVLKCLKNVMRFALRTQLETFRGTNEWRGSTARGIPLLRRLLMSLVCCRIFQV